MQTLSQYHVEQTDIRQLYHQLQHASRQHLDDARRFLREQLQQCAAYPLDLPSDPEQLETHVLRSNARTARTWRDYLLTRKQGQPRRYFSSRAHALYFLRNVAPTKLVDGAWLYGTLKHQQDPRMHGLIRTYLEELGNGEPEQNHVVLYKQLLARQDIQDHDDLPGERFIQGTVQLALGHLADEFLPEVIGYNLGYEQLPLHLLITTYELTELDIDPHYFRLHITVDNASTGHARRAARAVLENLPQDGRQHVFYERVCRGYLLNELGSSSTSVIEDFSLGKELCRVLEEKAKIARHMHSDRCRIEGRTINEWLDSRGQIPGLLDALQRHGWIRRHQDPEKAASGAWSPAPGRPCSASSAAMNYSCCMTGLPVNGSVKKPPELLARAVRRRVSAIWSRANTSDRKKSTCARPSVPCLRRRAWSTCGSCYHPPVTSHLPAWPRPGCSPGSYNQPSVSRISSR